MLERLLAGDASASAAHCAGALLRYDEGLSVLATARATHQPLSQVIRWLRLFRYRGMNLFRFKQGKPMTEQPIVEIPEEDEAGRRHAEWVCALALDLFDRTQPLHSLPEDRRGVLGSAARLIQLRPDQGAKKSIPILQDYIHRLSGSADSAYSLPELSAQEQAAVAGVIAFQRGKIKEDAVQELNLDAAWQHDVQILSAILRIALGLDDSETQQTKIQKLEIGEYGSYREARLVVDGPQALIDARSAQDEAQLWINLGMPHLMILEASADERPLLSEMPASPGVQPDDPMAEAGRKVMRYHFLEMLSHEEGTRQGEDIEALHDMRVATRRMRASFDVFGDAFKEKILQRYLKRLRATGRALGRVRDLDVFMEKAQAYLLTLPEADRPGLNPLLLDWKAQRDRARDEMLDHLNSREYQDFKREFGLFLNTPGLGARRVSQFPPEPFQVYSVAPVLIYTRFGEARSFDRILGNAQVEQLHALRIEFKKLRYTLEYFQEVLGKDAKGLISTLKTLQDHLGDLNDADVAIHILQEFLQQWDDQQKDRPLAERQNPEGVVNYLAYRHAERYRLMVTFQEAWLNFIRPEFRRDLAMAVSVL